MESTKTRRPLRRLLLGITALLIGLALALSIAVYAIWHHELSTLMSLE